MHDINILNKQELEKAFAEDFGSPIFPILGELYLKNKDLNRAKKVCKIGLKHDPNNINGYYILAKIYLYNNELKKAEKNLIKVIDIKPLHINALKLLVKLHEELDISKKNKLKYLKQLLDIFPNDSELKAKITHLDDQYLESTQSSPQPIEPTSINIIDSNINFNIKPSMATLTFVEILKEQKHYHQALHVLSLVELKAKESKKSKQLKSQLQKLLAELQ